MGSVIDYIECPNCGREACSDYYYKTGEEYVHCQNCGYCRNVVIKNKNKRLDELTEDDWEVDELKNPYGAYRIRYIGDVGYGCGSLESEKHLMEFKQHIEGLDNVELFSISRLVEGEIVVEYIVDKTSSNQTPNHEKIK